MFYIHVRAHPGATAFAVVGPYGSAEDAEAAAQFAHLAHFSVVQRVFDQPKLF